MRRLTDDDAGLVAGGADFTTTAADTGTLGQLVDYGSRELQGTYGWDGLTGPNPASLPTYTQWLGDDILFSCAAMLFTGAQS